MDRKIDVVERSIVKGTYVISTSSMVYIGEVFLLEMWMEDFERELLVARIMSGYTRCHVGDEIFLVHAPSYDLLYAAAELYAQTYRQAMITECFTDDDAYNLLVNEGKWSEEKEKQLKQVLPDHIEYWKVELYNAYFKTEESKKIRKYLAAAKEELEKFITIRSSYQHLVPEGIAASSKMLFLIENGTTTLDGEPCDWSTVSLNKVAHEFQKQFISDEQVRELSRTDPWVSYWQAHDAGGNIFPNAPLSQYQKRLISWSLLYQNIQESMEPPPSSVLDDDDMLDGWLIIQRRKREEAESKESVEGRIKGNERISNSSEIYIPVNNIEDAKRVDQANDARAKATKKQRMAIIKEKGRASELDFADVKMDICMQANRAGIDLMKGK